MENELLKYQRIFNNRGILKLETIYLTKEGRPVCGSVMPVGYVQNFKWCKNGR